MSRKVFRLAIQFSTFVGCILLSGCGIIGDRLSPSKRDDGGGLISTPFKQGSSTSLSVNPLNDLDIFLRCYTQLTGNDPEPNDQRIADIKNLKLSGRYACRQLFKSVALDSNGEVIASTDEKIAIFNRMHRLHSSFFNAKALLTESNPDFTKVKENILDPSAPALFYTKALFTLDEPFDNTFKGKRNLTANRSETLSTPTIAPSTSIFGANFDQSKYQRVGELRGISDTPRFEISYNIPAGAYPSSHGNVDFAGAFGGGIIGSPVYLQNNLLPPNYGDGASQPATSGEWDGGISIGRKWSVAIFKDFLCQDLPSLEPGDVSAPEFVSASTPVPFRNSSACSACHASMDLLAGGVRNIGYLPHGVKDAPPGATSMIGTTELFQLAAGTSALPELWPLQPDKNYSIRPPDGILFFRSSDGSLISEKFHNLDELGEIFINQTDTYRCLTKRYMDYFMGVRIPMKYSTLEENKDLYLAELKRLSLDFKHHRNLNKLVDQVLMSNLYGSK